MLSDRIVIRGTGLVTPLGVGVDPTWRALLAGRFITDHARCPLPAEPPAETAAARDEVDQVRVNRLARLAAAEAVASAGWAARWTGDERTALVVATSRGPADQWLDDPWAGTNPSGGTHADRVDGRAPGPVAAPPVAASDKHPAGRRTPSVRLSAVADAVAAAFGHGVGPRLTLSGACAGGLHAVIRAALLLAHGDADRAVVVAAESSLHPLFLQSFRRLGVLPPPGGRCRPFDVNRNGFLCAEAAAAVVLERAADNNDPRPGDVWLDRFALGGDATHLTGSDPAGVTLRRLLAVTIDGRPVDVIHAHGTGTEANDAAEAFAIDAVLADVAPGGVTEPGVYSHKGAIGHTVGAAGLVSVVLNVLMHREGVVPPNVGTDNPIPLRHARLSATAVEREVRRSVAIAAGFGGATAAVSLASVPD
ncbi:MAG: fabF [Phycisphaerales bacterium]|nr:fabF [Phycisphaerales bacterium]